MFTWLTSSLRTAGRTEYECLVGDFLEQEIDTLAQADHLINLGWGSYGAYTDAMAYATETSDKGLSSAVQCPTCRERD
jgi:hypothetical protein